MSPHDALQTAASLHNSHPQPSCAKNAHEAEMGDERQRRHIMLLDAGEGTLQRMSAEYGPNGTTDHT